MHLRWLAIAAALAILGSAGWNLRNSSWIQGLAGDTPPPREIRFDNGSFKDDLPASAMVASSQAAQSPPGAMRKCARGTQVSYTNLSCPPGFKELQVAGPPVNVVSGQAAAGTGKKPSKTDHKGALRDALDLSADDQLRQKIIDRAVDNPAR